MFRNFGTGEMIIILVIVMLLFGAKRMPDAARSLGRSLRIFKSETKAMGEDDEAPRTGTIVREPRQIDTPAPDAQQERSTAPESERTER